MQSSSSLEYIVKNYRKKNVDVPILQEDNNGNETCEAAQR